MGETVLLLHSSVIRRSVRRFDFLTNPVIVRKGVEGLLLQERRVYWMNTHHLATKFPRVILPVYRLRNSCTIRPGSPIQKSWMVIALWKAREVGLQAHHCVGSPVQTLLRTSLSGVSALRVGRLMNLFR